MAIIKQLKESEYSESRKQALKEITERKEHKIEVYSDRYVKCIKCNKGFLARLDVYEKLVNRFGSVYKLKTEYRCKQCRK